MTKRTAVTNIVIAVGVGLFIFGITGRAQPPWNLQGWEWYVDWTIGNRWLAAAGASLVVGGWLSRN